MLYKALENGEIQYIGNNSSEIGIDEKKLNKFLFMLYKKKIIEIL